LIIPSQKAHLTVHYGIEAKKSCTQMISKRGVGKKREGQEAPRFAATESGCAPDASVRTPTLT